MLNAHAKPLSPQRFIIFLKKLGVFAPLREAQRLGSFQEFFKRGKP
jgi:hypothetical protein